MDNSNSVFICSCCSFGDKGRRIAVYIASFLVNLLYIHDIRASY